MRDEMAQELWLIRHGETEWSAAGRHTGRTDVPLSPRGREDAKQQGQRLAGRTFALVLSSPLKRAIDSCALAGFGEAAEIDRDLAEWDYGVYEGETTAAVRQQIPAWSIWTAEIAGGESLDQVAARAQRVIDRCVAASGDVALFAHAHLLRILTACWLGLPPSAGRLLALDAGSVSVLGYEHETRVIRRWNRTF